MGSLVDTFGEIEEISRTGEDELSVEWRMPDIFSLYDEIMSDHYYGSPKFRIDGVNWSLRLRPHWKRESRDPASGWLRLDLTRLDGDPPKTFQFSVGIKGCGGVEKKREGEWEFTYDDYEYAWEDFCSRSEMVENKTRLMPDGVLIITCIVRRFVPGTTKGGLPSEVLVTYPYKVVQAATRNFSDQPLRAGGCKIGEGGFGTVYRAIIRGDVFAVKILKDPMDAQFITELKTLTNYKHENLVPLLGCSLGPKCCLLYEYMPNGSLEDKLACKDGSEPLSWKTRLSISYGTALGINHLHTFSEEPEVHRDIKSANILLDQNFVPKVGDFGLVRTGNSGGSTVKPVTKRCIGTPGYMPKEASLGDVSVKWDTFSFGVVILELLTGLPPYDPNRQYRFLITHMENCKDKLNRLDPKAKWNKKAATELYRITRKCLAESKRSRPTFSEILEDLRKLYLLE